MLRRLDVKDNWRSLDEGFWPDDLPAGSRTVIYGHNGSGKSTLAELLLSVAEGASATSVAWENEERQRKTIAAGGPGPARLMAVFTRKWVEENLSAFLDGDGAGASAIVTLGREAIDAKEQEERLLAEIQELSESASETEKQHKSANGKVNKLARDVQEQIVSALRAFDYSHFTKNRYSVTRIQEDLRNYKGEWPDAGAHADALKRLAEGAPTAVPKVSAPTTELASRLSGLSALLAETPTRVAISALDGNPAAQAWAERGLDLHEDADHCLFCAGELTEQRRTELARHFDESWLQIRAKAKDLLAAAEHEKETLTVWHAGLPAATRLTGRLQSVYATALNQAEAAVGDRVVVLEMIETTLGAKIADPSATPESSEWSLLREVPSITVLAQAIDEHNDDVRRHEEVTSELKQIVLDHLVGSQSATFRDLEAQAAELATESGTSRQGADLARRRLDEIRQAQFTTSDMAETLTKDLARVYGKDHLSVAVTGDGRSYACRRGDRPGTDLSDGERTTLSLLYFLRKLEDEQSPAGDRARRIVVIDDPSSSLDREALFATHQWLFDTLQGFGQYIILTHDFSLLRLFIKSHRSAWGKSMSNIKKGDTDEIRFPRASFLEMYAASDNGQRQSKIGTLPHVLLNSTSEYAYLFAMVMAGVADSEDHERLFLLPNAARRVLEVFASYKAPHRADFLQQLEVIVETREGEPFRDVYDFCNRFSHGEGGESVDVLDARAVHGQIRRCMEFLRAVDTQHFDRMCAATGAKLEPTP